MHTCTHMRASTRALLLVLFLIWALCFCPCLSVVLQTHVRVSQSQTFFQKNNKRHGLTVITGRIVHNFSFNLLCVNELLPCDIEICSHQ